MDVREPKIIEKVIENAIHYLHEGNTQEDTSYKSPSPFQEVHRKSLFQPINFKRRINFLKDENQIIVALSY
jgi:hypothetical protein